MPIKLDEKSFHARLDMMPPGPPRLIVYGTGEAPTTGWTVTLERAEPQGINPDVLILDVVAKAPDGIVAQHVTPVELRFEERPAHNNYAEVAIRYGAEYFTTKIEITV